MNHYHQAQQKYYQYYESFQIQQKYQQVKLAAVKQVDLSQMVNQE
jgi:hypothetical protein